MYFASGRALVMMGMAKSPTTAATISPLANMFARSEDFS